MSKFRKLVKARFIMYLSISLGNILSKWRLLFWVLIPFQVNAQLSQFSKLATLASLGSDDGNTLAYYYTKPLAYGLGNGLNSGWMFSSATQGNRFPKTKFSLSVSIRTTMITVPASDRGFDLSSIPLISHTFEQSSVAVAPTYSGYEDSYSYLNSKAELNGKPLYKFRMPGGTEKAPISLSYIQLGLGLFFDTDITVRYQPKQVSLNAINAVVPLDEFKSIEIMGASVRHGLNQWLPFGYKLPFEITIQAAATQFKSTTPVEVYFGDIGKTVGNISNQSTISAEYLAYQKINTKVTALTANAIIGKRFAYKFVGINFYIGGGIEQSNFELEAKGNYPVISYEFNMNTNAYQSVTSAITDPINLNYKTDKTLRYFGGARFNLGVLDFFVEYTKTNYSGLNFGAAVSFAAY